MNEDSVSVEVVRKIAALEGVDPEEITPPMFDVIDPGALDSLCRHANDAPTRSDVTVEFTYSGYSVVVESSGDVRLAQTESGIESSFREVEGTIGGPRPGVSDREA